MKTTLLLTVSALALLTSSCLTMYPVDPMTKKPSKEMLPENIKSHKNETSREQKTLM